ncbi:hypothetical protein DMUE_3102 [Dictyocoela muelleri]|nr:hypothetical protein DMUE_3102 [Dictyocoela muelleri]
MKNYIKLSNIGIINFSKYIRTEKMARGILKCFNILPTTKKCPLCRREMKFYDGKREYFYCRTTRKMNIPILHSSILQNLRIEYNKFILFCYLYFYRETVTSNLLRNLKISRTTIIELKKRIEAKIIYFNKSEPKLGGENSMVDSDESLIASSKYGYGYFPEQTWVFGVV